MKIFKFFICILFSCISINIFATEHICVNSQQTYSNQTFSNYAQVSPLLPLGGGVFYVYTEGSLNINDINFSTNLSKYGGGAILNRGVLNVNSSFFSSNTAQTFSGGAIINSQGIVVINSSRFIENTASDYGGAISNADGRITISSSIFSKNQTKLGGAIDNYNGIIDVISSVFSENFSTSQGGTILNRNKGNIIISSCSFTDNTSKFFGGAIDNFDNSSIVTIQDNTRFINNKAAGTYGGAIYNKGILNLIANTGNIEFTGNTANGVSNAIHDSYGTINLWASSNADIIFNDRITSTDNTSILNINSSTTTLTANGKTILNEDMSGYLGQVNLYDGEIELQAKTEGNSNINTNKFFSGNINLSSGTLNILNNAIDNITISTWTSTSNANLKIDTDLSNNTSDNFTITNSAEGVLNLTAINILGIDEKIGQIILFNDEKAPTLNILTTGNYGGQEYVFTNSDIAGVLDYRLSGYRTFKETINDSEPLVRSYSLAENETVTQDLGQLGGTQLTIFGNGYEINGSSKAGITVSNGQTLNIEKGTGENFVWEKFDTNEHGGAIYNSLGMVNIGNDVVFTSNTATRGGGAITNKTTTNYFNIGNNATFSNNSVSQFDGGGAIFNLGNLVIGSSAIFSNNTENATNSSYSFWVLSGGGAIYNAAGIEEDGIITSAHLTIGDNSLFENNKANNLGSGGAIFNISRMENNNCEIIIKDNVRFLYNTAYDGGAIANILNALITIGNNAVFSSNTARGVGGAISNSGGTIVIGAGVQFNANTSDQFGGAIYADEGMLTIGDDANFVGNSSNSGGGAIYNDGKVTIGSNAIFDTNYSEYHGGAIYNCDANYNMTIGSDVKFINNNSNNCGGAIYNSSRFVIEDGVNFIGNIADSVGGAIYNKKGNFDLIANTNNVEFTGNTANGISNAIHDNGGTINMWASQNADIIFNDRITSSNNTSILNINSSTTTLTANGKIILNEDMSGYTGQVNLYNGTIEFGEKGKWFGGDVNLNSETGITIKIANNIINEHNFKTISLTDDLNLSVDADLADKQMDTITANSFSGNGKINVKAINILNDAKENKTEILFTSSTVLKDKITSINTASSKLYKYDVNYSKDTGIFKFFVTATNSPIIVESQVARATGLITQNTVLNQAFSSIDNIRNRIIQAKQKGLLYASTADVIFESPNRIESGLWIRPFMSQDTISFDSFDVDNNLTGTLAGIDLVAGENNLLSFYLGYAGSNQKYEDIQVNQTGYIVGATGMIIKERWYAGLTANVNFNKAESQSKYGTDSFDLNMYSIGAKAGYNFDLSDKFILEPNLTLMYGNVGNQEYETTQGAKIDSQSTANIIAEPQVKAKLNLTNGWQPYGLLGYLINAGEKVKLVADNIAFDDMEINGYVEYGVGVNKTFKNSPWSCYLQLTGKSGDISGFDGNIGIKYSFLNKEEKEDIELIKYLKEKEKKKLKEQQEKQKAFEEEQKRIEKEEKERLEREEKARIEEEKRIKQEEKERQKALEEERIKTEKEEQEKQRLLEIERKLQEYYD